MKLKIILVIFLITTRVSTLFGADVIDKTALRNEIKSRLENILLAKDDGAKIDVSLFYKKSSSVDYSNPFILASKNESSSESGLSKVSVTVFTQFVKDDFSESIQKRLNSILREYSPKYVITYEKNFISKESLWNKLYKLKTFEMVIVFFATLGFISLVFFRFSDNRKDSNSGLSELVKESVNTLKGSIDNLSLAQVTHQGSNDFASVSKPFSLEISSGNDSFLKDFSTESLHELLMDCYWCEEDEYAAFLWGKLDLANKGKLLAKDSRIGDYANYISTIEGVDKKYINETYYFNPYNISGISNINLTKLVLKFNSLFHLLPKLRVSALGIDATEKKKLMVKKFSKKDTELELHSIKWGEYITTEKRIFESVHVFNFESHDEEELFFKDPSLDISLAHSFPSLGWLILLGSRDIENVLASFSAKELAMAWDAPEVVLIKLEAMLPEKKAELLSSYREQIKASRSSSVFKQIVKLAAVKLQSTQAEKSHPATLKLAS